MRKETLFNTRMIKDHSREKACVNTSEQMKMEENKVSRRILKWLAQINLVMDETLAVMLCVRYAADIQEGQIILEF